MDLRSDDMMPERKALPTALPELQTIFEPVTYGSRCGNTFMPQAVPVSKYGLFERSEFPYLLTKRELRRHD